MLNVAVSIPVVKNIITAVIERAESLGRPHKPCPLVHPEANCVPTPTRNPAIMRCVFEPDIVASKGLNYDKFFIFI